MVEHAKALLLGACRAEGNHDFDVASRVAANQAAPLQISDGLGRFEISQCSPPFSQEPPASTVPVPLLSLAINSLPQIAHVPECIGESAIEQPVLLLQF